MNSPLLLRGVDRAAFAAALVSRMREGGVVVSASGPAGFVQALAELVPRTLSELYWAARLTLVNRMEDLAAFDGVFEAVFDDAGLALYAPGRKAGKGLPASSVPGARGRDGSARRG